MTRLAAVALAAVAIAPAASAQAASSNGATDVAQHLKKATTATGKLTKHVNAGRDAQALKVLKTARRETTTAAKDARRLANRASTDPQIQRAIWALAAAGAAQAQSMGDYADLIENASAQVQAALANALPSSLASRDAVIASLTALIQRIDDPELQALASQALAALAAQTPATLDELAAIPVDQLPIRVAAIIQTALQSATAAIELVTGNLSALIPGLPAGAQAPISQALTTVSQLLTGITATVTEITGSVAASLQEIIAMLQPVLGQLPGVSTILPGAGSGTPAGAPTGSVVPSLPSLGGLIPDLSTIVPGFGGLLNQLLGGLPIVGNLLGGR